MTNYLTQHLQEAIQINKIRKPLYADLTNKRSLKISRALILAEQVSLLKSIPADNIAKYWQRRGIPVMVHEFISMNQTPKFKRSFQDSFGLCSSMPQLDTKAIENKLLKLSSTKKYQTIVTECKDVLAHMSSYNKHLCTVRHLIESIGRSAFLFSKHLDYAQKLSVKSPYRLLNYMLNSQIKIIHSSKILDKWAFPLQQDGIPIIYQDVPHIEIEVSEY